MAAIRFRDVHGVAEELGVDVQTVRRWIQSGKLRAFKPGKEYRIRETDLEEFLAAREVRPKGPAPSPLELSFNDILEGERRVDWEAAVEEGRRLRDSGWAQMWEALSEWRASKKRGEPYAVRREFLDEMGNLLQEVYDADTALGHSYIAAALTQGGSDAEVPSFLREESRSIAHFYGELFGLARSAGLSIRSGSDAVAAKAESESRPSGVEEDPAA